MAELDSKVLATVKHNFGKQVTAGLTYTRNLGNFENVRVHVEVSDTAREDETVNAAFERVYSFVEAKLQEKVEEIEADLKG